MYITGQNPSEMLYFLGILQLHLTKAATLCYNFHDFRQEAGPAGRSPPYTIFSRRIFETDAMKGSAVGLQADWQALFLFFCGAVTGGNR